MTDNEYNPTRVSPPGDTLKDLLWELGMPPRALAHKMGTARSTVDRILAGTQRLTPTLAAALAKATNTHVDFWLARESYYALCRREPKRQPTAPKADDSDPPPKT